MLQTNFEVVHVVPGRLRLRVPRVRYDEPYALRLQGLLEATDGVTGVRVNPAAKSITIDCAGAWFNDPDLQAGIFNSLGGALDPGITPQISVNFDIYCAHGLSNYEFQQLQEVKNCWLAQPGGVNLWLAGIVGIFSAVGDRLIPQEVFQKIFEVHEHVAGRWQEYWQTLQAEARLADCRDLSSAPLEVCDRLAERVRQESLRLGQSQGALLGILGPVGLIGGIPLSIVQALKTIHHFGLCYGYPPDTETEKLFSYAILAAATAHTPEDKQAAVDNLRQIHHGIYRQATDDLLKDTEVAEITGQTKEAILELAIGYFGETAVMYGIPIIGAVLGAVAMRSFVSDISTTAQRSYQLRWLLKNQKVDIETAGKHA
jgi:hypothetical protein